MQLFYNPKLTIKDKEIKFDKKESGHIVRVLRKGKGDELHITNGKGYSFLASIIAANPHRCTAKIIDSEIHRPPPYTLHMAVAPTKRNERFEWFLEKATEIGIGKITPVICAHSERQHVKLKRYNRVLESAMKQSLQYYLPTINAPVTFSEFLSKPEGHPRFIAHCGEDTDKVFFKDKIAPATSITVLIGPEGDFSPEEIGSAMKKDFKPVSLGHSRLRTETAALAACHTVALVNQ